MITVSKALSHIFAQLETLPSEIVPLRQVFGRVLAEDVVAKRNQPPFHGSIMDGYALRNSEVHPGAVFKVIGESAAGHNFNGRIESGEALRIFTGAPLPDGADRVVIQEDVSRSDDTITLNNSIDSAIYVRATGADFTQGSTIAGPQRLTAANLALLAAMNIPEVSVTRRPNVALLATGDELVMPGENPASDQIIASNIFGLAAIVEAEGGIARILPIARDNRVSLATAFDLAKDADLIVTIGGASVGDHDLVGDVALELGMQQAFYKVKMRPGKPLMAGKIGTTPIIGLPGNPVSAMVCGHVFLRPALRALQGLPAQALSEKTAPLANSLSKNGGREHYMRATLSSDGLRVAERQDSALLTVLAQSNVLVVRPPDDPARNAGEYLAYLEL